VLRNLPPCLLRPPLALRCGRGRKRLGPGNVVFENIASKKVGCLRETILNPSFLYRRMIHPHPPQKEGGLEGSALQRGAGLAPLAKRHAQRPGGGTPSGAVHLFEVKVDRADTGPSARADRARMKALVSDRQMVQPACCPFLDSTPRTSLYPASLAG